jgi:hypothetical protein
MSANTLVKVYDVSTGSSHATRTDLDSIFTGDAFELTAELDPTGAAKIHSLPKPWQTCFLAQHPEVLKRQKDGFPDCTIWDVRDPFFFERHGNTPIVQIYGWQEEGPVPGLTDKFDCIEVVQVKDGQQKTLQAWGTRILEAEIRRRLAEACILITNA